MLLRRILQFLMIYLIGLTVLLLIKYGAGLSDYVIPGPAAVLATAREVAARYVHDVIDTLLVAVIGQLASIILAVLVGILGRQATWFGSFIKVAA